MKQLLTILIIFIVGISVPSCKNMVQEDSHMLYIDQMKDSVFKAYPTVGSVWMDLVDGSDFIIVLGDAKLYNASADAKQKEATELGEMALRIFGKDNKIEKGKLVLTKDLRNSKEDPADGITISMNIDSLKKLSAAGK